MARSSVARCLLTVVALATAAPAAAQGTDWAAHHRDRVAAFARQNRSLEPDQRYVVLVGDSLTEGFGYGGRQRRYLPTLHPRTLNRGISSDRAGRSRGVLARLEASVFDCQPSHVFLLVGVNQIGGDGSGIDATARDYEEIVRQIRARLPDVVLVAVTTTPARGHYAHLNAPIRRYNQRVAEIAGRYGLRLLDLHALLADSDGAMPAGMTGDGLHFNDRGYAIYGREIERIVAEEAGDAGLPLPRTEPAAPVQPDLARGSRGPDVEALQRDLNRARAASGRSPIGVDGKFGPETAGAVQAFQRRAGLPATGRVDAATRQALARALAGPGPDDHADAGDEGHAGGSARGARGAAGALAGAEPGDLVLRPGPTLRRGQQSGQVAWLQTFLNDARRGAGLDPIGVDGDFGPGTERAVRAYQRTAGLPETGVADDATWRSLLEANRGGPLGVLNPAAFPAESTRYARRRNQERRVTVHALPEVGGSHPLVFESKMAIDADGAGDAWEGDRTGQPQTSLTYRDGRSVNPGELNFFVLPIGFEQAHAGVRLGDLAAITYRGRTAFAIFADRGPRGRVGEGSLRLARSLGINADPNRGGASSGVTYMVFPGSGTGRPLAQAEIDRRGAALLRDALRAAGAK